MTPYYEHAGITIYHGDCREVLPHVDPVNAVVTSPPYNVLHTIPEHGSGMRKPPEGKKTARGGAGFHAALASRGYDDKTNEAAYQSWQNDIFSAIPCADKASLFYNHQERWIDGECVHPVRWFSPVGWSLRQEIIWDRSVGMMLNARMFCRYDERILWFVRGRWKWNQSFVGLGTVWRIACEQNKPHPVAYPLEIPRRCIAAATDPGDLVLDPFMGSGTTLVAAKDLGRKAIGIEIEEKYCEIAARRLAQEVLPL